VPRVQAEEDWREVKHDADNDVVVYLRKLPNGYTEFKGVTHVKSSLAACIALLRDVDSMPEWVDRTLKAKIIDRVSDTEVYAYNVSRMPWPFKSRDAIVHTILEQHPDTLTITINGTSVDKYEGPTEYDYTAEEHRYVRLAHVKSFWRFAPRGNGIVEVTFQGYGDPGGNTSAPLFRWLIGKLIWQSPYRTLHNLRQVIGRDEYQSASFDFIMEPETAKPEE